MLANQLTSLISEARSWSSLYAMPLCRFGAILQPLQLNSWKRRGRLMLAIAWTASFICSLPQVLILLKITLVVCTKYRCIVKSYSDAGSWTYEQRSVSLVSPHKNFNKVLMFSLRLQRGSSTQSDYLTSALLLFFFSNVIYYALGFHLSCGISPGLSLVRTVRHI